MTNEAVVAMLWARRKTLDGARAMFVANDNDERTCLHRVLVEYVEAAIGTTEAYLADQTTYREIRMITANRVLDLLLLDIHQHRPQP